MSNTHSINKRKYRITSIIIVLILSIRLLLAQDDPGWGNDPVGVPLDGGLLSLLLAGGIGLYLRKRKKSKE